MAHYSILIKNGRVIDGTGALMRKADVGVLDERIADVGDLAGSGADTVIDAAGKYVTPGFVDLTGHSDTHWTLFTQPTQESLLCQGITTVLGGNCGSSLAPLVSGEDIEGIGRWANIREININWQTFAELQSVLRERAFGVNVASLVGFGTLRRGVIGEENRAADGEEIRQIKFLLSRSFDDGAAGISFNLGASHEQAARDHEIAEVLHVAAGATRLVKHHLEDEGQHLLPALSRVLGFARRTNARTQISHFKALGRGAWEQFQTALEMIERARDAGFAVTVDFFPYTRTGSRLIDVLPAWVREGSESQIISRLRDEGRRKDVHDAIKALTLHYERITIASVLRGGSSVGDTIAAVSARSGLAPEAVIVELLVHNELNVAIFNEVIASEHLETLATKPYALIASDGVGYALGARLQMDFPHPRSFGAFPQALAWFVKDRNVIGWEALLHKMTGLPAAAAGIRNRGLVSPGAFADIVLFDPERIAAPADYANPYQAENGIDTVLVNGGIALRDGTLNKQSFGRFITVSS